MHPFMYVVANSINEAIELPRSPRQPVPGRWNDAGGSHEIRP